MPKLIVMVGIQGSGKSTLAEKIAKKERAELISSDELRFKVTGRKTNEELFTEIYEKTDKFLKEGKNVVIDATNIEQHRRIKLCNRFKDYQKVCYFMNTSYETCIEQNKKRKKPVREQVIREARLKLSIPSVKEGWDEVIMVHEEKHPTYEGQKERFENLVINAKNYEELFKGLIELKLFSDIYKFDQDNPNHSLLLCEHTYLVYEYVRENYIEDDRLIMLWASLFHDTGKPFAKAYKTGRTHASYVFHENVSAQLCARTLHELGYDDEFVGKVVEIVQFHMEKMYRKDNATLLGDLYNFVGSDTDYKLTIHRNADDYAR